MGLWTNLLKQSANLDDTASPWSGNGDFTIAEAVSLIPGQAAYQHTSTGAGNRARIQTVGTLSSGQETAAVAMENVSAARIQLGIRDVTANDWVGWVQLVYSTGSVTVIGDAQGTVDDFGVVALERTPNGGTESVVLWLTATPDTPGNSRAVWAYPADTTGTDAGILHWVGLFEAATYAPAYLVNGATVTEQRVIDLGDHKVSVRPSARYVDLDHKRRRASGKLSSTLHGDAVRRREWTFGTEIEGRTTGEELQRELDAPGTVHLVHNPLISSVTGVGAGVDATNVRRMDGPQEDHVRVTFDAVEVVPA